MVGIDLEETYIIRSKPLGIENGSTKILSPNLSGVGHLYNPCSRIIEKGDSDDVQNK